MGYCRIRPRTIPIDRDEEKIKEFKENFRLEYGDKEVWFFDETGIENDSRPRYAWGRKGSKPIWYYRGNHIRDNVLGAVNPSSGELETLIMPYNDTNIFQYFLDQFKKRTENREVVMILDNASWHKTTRLRWNNITPVYLPPYAPDLNPIEQLWRVIKDNLCDPIPAKDYEEHQDRIQLVLKMLMSKKEEVKLTCKIPY